MRTLNKLVFDENIPAGTTAFTSAEFYGPLGAPDALAMQAIVDNVTTTGTLTAQIRHSADGRNFVAKNGTAEINAQTITLNTTTVLVGADQGITPSLGLIQISIAVTQTAHVKLYITARDKAAGSAQG